ncbi:esterase-like activity of phytase family protein [Vibrio gangliei]|uniref:esterase-like activity of phytase family protein n=1 Tax=Vibrio gangliei TaxID=2077090 RepID=UPI000D014926|nr:esterase-like activity of phytase family protein [Vibrio gangliei]
MKPLTLLAISLSTLFAVSTQAALTPNQAKVMAMQSGTQLPYNVMKSDIPDAERAGKTLELRNGAFGSDMAADPRNPNRFYALTDRGPNADIKGQYGKGKIFPTPDYTPRIGHFEIQTDGSIQLINTILLKDTSGNVITGLPNTANLGGTGETPYQLDGQPVTIDASKPFDKTNNPVKLDDFGLDSEGLVALSDGTFWVSDEYGPHIVHFDASGKEIGRINAFTQDSRDVFHLPAEFANRRANRGMEGLAVSKDEKTLIGIMQSSMANPTKKQQDLDLTRIVTVNLETGKIGQYLYHQDKNGNSNSGIKSLGNQQFVVIERDGKFLNQDANAQKDIYRIDLRNATDLEALPSNDHLKQDEKLGLMIDGKTVEQFVQDNGWDALKQYGIQPAEKTLLVNLAKTIHYPHDKLEGMWVIDDSHIGVLNDDDFAIAPAGKNQVTQKYLTPDRIDGSTLYIVGDLDLKAQ